MKLNFKLAWFITFLLVSGNVFAVTENNKNAIQRVNTSFSKLCQANQFSGVVLVAINGKVQFENACGLASREFHAANTVDTQFNLGSVGKLFTSVAIAQLIERKKLSLDVAVITLLPTWLPMPQANDITVWQLLTHRSGLGNFMEDKRWQLGADSGLFNDTDTYEPLIQAQPLLFSPGTSSTYSNSGYLVLGKIIEKLSGESYSQYIKQHIFDKANMEHTGIYALDEVVQNRATGYYYSCKKQPCSWKNNNCEAPFMGSSAGGAYSTVGDLFKFSQALYHHKLLNTALTLQLLSPIAVSSSKGIWFKKIKIGDSDVLEPFSPYGFAGVWNQFGIAIWDKDDLIGHTGGTTGASALFIMSPENRYTFIILSNMDVGTLKMVKNIRNAFHFKGDISNF